MPPIDLVKRVGQWLAESRPRQIAASGVALLTIATAAGTIFVLATSGGDGELDPIVVVQTAAPSRPATPARATQRATAVPTPTAITKPDTQTLLRPGYVLDQSLEVNLDGSETGQIVVISHTTRQVLVCSGQALNPKTGDPLPSPVGGCDDATLAAIPARGNCPTDPSEEFDASACTYRLEVFSFDQAAGWGAEFVSYQHRGGIQGGMDVVAFQLGESRQGLVLTADYCTGVGSGCGTQLEVLAVRDGEVTRVYNAWKAGATAEGDSVVVSEPVYADSPLNMGFCCPYARLQTTIGLDSQTGKVMLIGRELPLCTEGSFVKFSGQAAETVFVRCGGDAPGNQAGYVTTDQTVVQPASVGGVVGLGEDHRIKVEYTIKECPQSLLDCSPDIMTPVATKITVLNP